MKKLFIISLAAGFCIAGTAVNAIHETLPAETEITLPSAQDPQGVFRYIKILEPYSEWSLWPGKTKLYTGRHPQGQLLTTYVNDKGMLGVRRGEPMQPGSFIVKEVYTPEKKLAAINVMYKVAGYNPGTGDWFWGEYGSNGAVRKAGRVQECINCHAAKKANDFVMTEDFVK
jgi:hypothetical protein